MKKIITVFTTLLLSIMLALPASAHPARLVDEAGILTEDEVYDLTSILNQFSEELSFDIAVVTVNSLEGESAEAFADDYYDYNGYGMGDNYDGALLLVSMEEREWHITTCGYGISAISDNDLYEIEDTLVYQLSEGNYSIAFEYFAWCCYNEVKDAMAAGVSGEAESMNPIVGLLLSLIIGFVLAFIPMIFMKRKMKSVNPRMEASDYMNRSSRRVTRSHDRFLYHTINRVYTPKQEHSSTHTSSSGRSHGGHGGGF